MSDDKFIVAIGVDNSEYAQKAFDWYVANIATKNDYVILICVPEVASTATHGGMPLSPGAWHALLEDEKKATKHLEQKFEQKLRDAHMHGRWITVNYVGNCGEAIVKVAKAEGARLIVMGSRGLGTLRRTIMGSVSDYVLHHAHTPVLVYKH